MKVAAVRGPIRDASCRQSRVTVVYVFDDEELVRDRRPYDIERPHRSVLAMCGWDRLERGRTTPDVCR